MFMRGQFMSGSAWKFPLDARKSDSLGHFITPDFRSITPRPKRFLLLSAAHAASAVEPRIGQAPAKL
jgi:hypothetical protein